MRLFTGIALPAEVQGSLKRLLDHLRPYAQVSWSPVYNLHITTKFIGEWPDERLQDIVQALEQMPKPGPFPIELSGLGWFPNPHSPRILWASVRAGEPLAQLAAGTQSALEPLGIARDTKPFSAHLTLARVREPNPLTELKRAIAGLTSVDFGSFTPDAFHLYRSQPGPSSSIYTSLAEIKLI